MFVFLICFNARAINNLPQQAVRDFALHTFYEITTKRFVVGCGADCRKISGAGEPDI